MEKIKIKKIRTVKNCVHNFTEYIAVSGDIIYATIYQGYRNWYRTNINIAMKNWSWVIRYRKEDKWEYEHFKYFRDASKRVIEIIKTKKEIK